MPDKQRTGAKRTTKPRTEEPEAVRGSALPSEFTPEAMDFTQRKWKSRIVGHRTRDPNELLANPENWRIHPRAQQEAIEGELESLGWIDTVKVNVNKDDPRCFDVVVDGHLRTARAIAKGEPVETTELWLSYEEQQRALAMFDALTGMAGVDMEKRRQLVEDVLGRTGAGNMAQATRDLLTKQREAIEKSLGKKGTKDKATDDRREGSIYALRSDVIFPVSDVTTNPLELPELLPDMLAMHVPTRVWNGVEKVGPARSDYIFIYGTSKPPEDAASRIDEDTDEVIQIGGTLAFYTDDYRFNVVRNNPVEVVAKLQDFGWGAVVMPDFSMHFDEPLYKALTAFGDAAWVARFWQEVGIPVIPNVTFTTKETYPWVKAVIPKYAHVVSTQVRTMSRNDKQGQKLDIAGLQNTLGMLEPAHVLLYGGVYHREWLEPHLPQGPRYHWLPAWTNLRRETGVMQRNRYGDQAVMTTSDEMPSGRMGTKPRRRSTSTQES